MDTIQKLSKERITVSMILLSAEMQVCKLITKATNGTFRVVLHETHFKELISEHLIPPTVTEKFSNNSNMILMGFPNIITANLFLCSW
jgi:transcription initiation factor TFIIH subunit 2